MEKFKKGLTESINWFVIVVLLLFYTVLGLMRIENGQIVLTDFSNFTWLDWTFWAMLTFTPAIISVVIATTFKSQGIKDAEEKIANVIDEYEKLLYVNLEKKVRGKSEYLAKGALVMSVKNFISASAVAVIAGQLTMQMSTDGLFKVLLNVALWTVMGFLAYGKSFNYGKSELKEWYIIETSKLKKRKDEEEQVRKKELEEAKAEVKKQANLIMEQKDSAYNKLKQKFETSIVIDPKILMNWHSIVDTLFETAKHDQNGLASVGLIPLRKILTDMEMVLPQGQPGEKGIKNVSS